MYWGYGLTFKPVEVTELFINNAEKLKKATDWFDQFEKLFIQDPLVLSTDRFVRPLNDHVALVTKSEVIDIHSNKTSDLLIDANDIRSGLQISEKSLSQFIVTNNFRRRAHGFLYKMKIITEAGEEQVIKDDIGIDTKAERDFYIEPVAGVTSFVGELGKVIEGTAIESFAKQSAPYSIDLAENENEATYKLRIVGAGRPYTNNTKTKDEILQLTRLELETFALDFLMPLIADGVGGRKKQHTFSEGTKVQVISATEQFLKNFPEIYDAMKSGNIRVGVERTLQNFATSEGVAYLRILAVAGIGIAIHEDISDKAEKAVQVVYGATGAITKIIGTIDNIMKNSDFIRLADHIMSSHQVEEWSIKARSSKVTLSPHESSVVSFKNLEVKAEIKNLAENGDVHPFFEWKTSGKYGKISDTKGHQGTSFESADPAVRYYSNASQASLSDSNNLEYIYVRAFLGSKFIGADTAVINVKKHQYLIKPDGITPSGKEGATNSEVHLYLELADGSNEIKPNGQVDYKVIWSTAGKHGKLYGKGIDAVKTLTTYDDNEAWYDCLDKDTKESTEKIYARIYSKPKNTPGADYTLFDEVEATIKINNDPKKRILHKRLTFVHGDSSYPFRSNNKDYTSYLCHRSRVVTFEEDKDAVSYHVRFYEVSPKTIGAPTSHSWKAGDPSPYAPPHWARPGYANGQYTVMYSWGSSNGPRDPHENGANPYPNGTPTDGTGMAEITIFLK